MSISSGGNVRPPRRRLSRTILLIGGCTACGIASADLEEVRILQAEPVQVQACPSTQSAVPPAPVPPASSGITGKEILGTAAGALVGGVLGNQVGRGSGRTAATVVGAGAGGFAGYKLTEEKPQQQAQQPQPACTSATQYRVRYSRSNGAQGDVMMSSAPTSQILMINFCGDRPCN